MSDNVASPERQHHKRWDPLVWVTHWGIAAAVLVNGILTSATWSLHILIGYGALALLVLRLVWGVVGTREARFSAFPFSLSATWRYLADWRAGRPPPHHIRSPLNALIAYGLWALLALVSVTGLAMERPPHSYQSFGAAVESGQIQPRGEAHGRGRGHGWRDGGRADGRGWGRRKDTFAEAHDIAAKLLLALSAVHVVVVVLEGRRWHRQGTGGKAGDRYERDR